MQLHTGIIAGHKLLAIPLYGRGTFGMFGLLNVDKPSGITSRDVVNSVQRIVRPLRVGHAGTLDPLASGVLVLCLGRATRLVPYLQRLPKQYLATFQLGRRSTSDDVEEQVEIMAGDPQPGRAQIEAAVPNFLGTISQRPPLYSALKVRGQRAYKLARAGADLKLSERDVHIYELKVNSFDYPTLVLDIACGSGTYVRALGRDLAESLGTHAVMSALQRTAIGQFTVDTSVALARLARDTLNSHLLAPALAVADLPQITVSDQDRHLLGHGRDVTRPNHRLVGEIAVLDDGGNLVSIVTPRSDDLLRPVRNF